MINVTPIAAEKISELLTEENKPTAGLRVFVQGGGCSGFQYNFSFEGERLEDDLVIERDGAAVLVASTSLELLKGSEVAVRLTQNGAVHGMTRKLAKGAEEDLNLVLGLLADRSFPRTRFGLAKIAALLAYGAAIEAVQYFLPWREASLPDILADAAGIALYAATRPLFLMIPVFRPPPNG